MVVGREKALLISEDGEKYSPEEIEEAIVNSSPIINQAMIYNDHKKNTTALVTINKKEIENLIDGKQINSHSEILKRTKEEIHLFKNQAEFKGKFPEKWIPTNFQIIEEDFSEANKMINSTMKMVRHRITENYQDRLDVMYQEGAKEKSDLENINTMQRMFNI